MDADGAADADGLVGVGVAEGNLDFDRIAGHMILQCKEFFHE